MMRMVMIAMMMTTTSSCVPDSWVKIVLRSATWESLLPVHLIIIIIIIAVVIIIIIVVVIVITIIIMAGLWPAGQDGIVA